MRPSAAERWRRAGYAGIPGGGWVRASYLVCRHIIDALERPLHGPDVNAQLVGDGLIVETIAAQVAYPFPAFIPVLPSRGGARLPLNVSIFRLP